jgi:hypothetical protein
LAVSQHLACQLQNCFQHHPQNKPQLSVHRLSSGFPSFRQTVTLGGSMFRLRCLALLGLLSIFLSSPSLLAQTSIAVVQGTVTDSTGAAVQNASIKITNTSTGISANTTSNSRGYYTFPQLAIGGPYTIDIDASGFKKFESTGIMLNNNDNREINAKLDLGSTSQTVEISATNVQVETADTQLKDTIDAQQIEDLPLFGRDASGLQKFTAGSVESSDRFGTYSANGTQTSGNSFILDGVDINDGPLQTEGFTISPDALAQETIVTSTINPEYSRNSGAVINQTIKSGSNKFHGSGFEFYRDTFLNNGDYFSLPGQRPPFHQNLYGGTVGGPIFKDKLFFFLSYQGYRNKTGSTVQTPVPTSAEVAGNFGAGAFSTNPIPFDIAGCVADGVNTWASCFPDGVIPPTAYNAISAKLQQEFVPAPNTPNGLLYNFSTANTGAADQGVLKFDYHLSEKDALWASSTFDSFPTTETLPFTGATLPGFGEIDAAHVKIFSADYTHTFSPSLLNEFQANYFRFNFAAVEPQKVVLPSSYGFNINPQSPSAGLPLMSVLGLFDLGFSNNGPQPRKDTNLRGADTVTWVKGGHTLKFGASVEQFRVSNPFYGNNNGNFAFNGGGPTSSGVPFADFLLGVPDSYSQGSGGFIDALAYENYFFAQDSWKVNPDLVVNYGAALDIETPNKNRQYKGLGVICYSNSAVVTGQFQGADAPPGLLYPGDAGCNSYGGPSVRYDHVAPRLGIAWSPSSGPSALLGAEGQHQLSIRAGFGVYYNRDQEEGSLQNLSAPPFSLNANVSSPNFASPIPGTNPFPFVPQSAGSTIDWSNFTTLDINAIDKNYGVPYVYNFNLNVQRELPGNVVLQVGYVGSLGHKLLIVYEGDPVTPTGHAACVADVNGCGAANQLATHLFYPQYTANPALFPGNPDGLPNGTPYYLSVGTQATEGASNYHSLQITATKSTSHGLSFSTTYSFSKALDNASGLESSGFNGHGYNQYPGYGGLNYGPSDYDARQRFTALYLYKVPVLHTSNLLLREAVSGWELTGVTALQTGNPVNITDFGVYLSKWCDEFGYYACPDTPNTSSFAIKKFNPRNGTRLYFDPTPFSQEALGSFGNVGRGLVHGPGFNYTNLSISKNFPISSDGVRSIQIRLDAANAFNHPNFAQPDGNFTDGNQFGVVRTVKSSADVNGDPQGGRAVQLGGKFYF